MDCSWLLDEGQDNDEGEDNLGSEKSECDETEHELESRLYAIIHHNDLSKPLPEDLAKHYSLQHSDDGGVTVTLNHSLEELKYEESKEIDQLIESAKSSDKEIVVISDDEKAVNESTEDKPIRKRFRYSDVNIDEVNKSYNNNININKVNTSHNSDVNIDEVNKSNNNNVNTDYMEFRNVRSSVNRGSILFKNANFVGNKDLSNLSIPSFFDFSNLEPNFDIKSKLIVSKRTIHDPQFKQKLRKQLYHLNPGVKKKRIFRLADVLWKQSLQISKRLKQQEIKNVMRNNLINGSDIMKNLSVGVEDDDCTIIEEVRNNNVKTPERSYGDMYLNLSPSKHVQPTIDFTERKQNCSESRRGRRMDGCISLRSSPFKPTNLDRETEDECTNNSSKNTQSHVPAKWNKKMIAYYCKPLNSKLCDSMHQIHDKLRKTTTKEDWYLDPQDMTGVYKKPQTNNPQHLQRRCTNCSRKGHAAKNCPEPKKTLTCFICGDYNHSGYSCQKAVCLKCGVLSPEAECVECYYHTFEYNMRCERCGSALHRTPHCPDAWRSFHSTTEGELKVPEKCLENHRKFCCNCARWGHFSHNCLTPSHSGQQENPFITNYSTSPLQTGSTDVFLPNRFKEIIFSTEGDYFLQNVSEMFKAGITVNDEDKGLLLQINGTFEQCVNVRSEIEEYVNTKKRKREEPPMRRKRRRLR